MVLAMEATGRMIYEAFHEWMETSLRDDEARGEVVRPWPNGVWRSLGEDTALKARCEAWVVGGGADAAVFALQ